MTKSHLKLAFAIGSLILVSTSLCSLPSQAAANLGFRCSVTTKICSCDVNTVGDCDGMKKNCKDGSIGWCNEINGKNICFCGMGRSGFRKDKFKSLQNVPNATPQ